MGYKYPLAMLYFRYFEITWAAIFISVIVTSLRLQLPVIYVIALYFSHINQRKPRFFRAENILGSRRRREKAYVCPLSPHVAVTALRYCL